VNIQSLKLWASNEKLNFLFASRRKNLKHENNVVDITNIFETRTRIGEMKKKKPSPKWLPNLGCFHLFARFTFENDYISFLVCLPPYQGAARQQWGMSNECHIGRRFFKHVHLLQITNKRNWEKKSICFGKISIGTGSRELQFKWEKKATLA